MYNPIPLDTTTVLIPEDLNNLITMLASNTHDVWARARIDEGWKYGLIKSSEEKTTPCLVPYDELPESEKDYDIATVTETIKVILSLGYQITKGEQST